MNLYSLSRRLDQLDALTPDTAPRRVIRLIVGEDGETQDVAIARWSADHPDEAPPSDADFIILRSLVSPDHDKRD